MLKLDAFTGKELQNFLGIIDTAINEGLPDILTFKKEVKDYFEKVVNMPEINKKVEKTICPGCGSKSLFPVFNSDNLDIVGCKKCRYSKIVEVQNE